VAEQTLDANAILLWCFARMCWQTAGIPLTFCLLGSHVRDRVTCLQDY